VLLAHCFATLCMVGIIWFVQIVHYPLFVSIDGRCFATYESEHQRKTTQIVAPLMLLELTSAVLLFAIASTLLAIVGIVLLGVVWWSTFAVQVPYHQRLVREFDATIVRRLVFSNWLRTIAWTARGILSLVLLILAR